MVIVKSDKLLLFISFVHIQTEVIILILLMINLTYPAFLFINLLLTKNEYGRKLIINDCNIVFMVSKNIRFKLSFFL